MFYVLGRMCLGEYANVQVSAMAHGPLVFLIKEHSDGCGEQVMSCSLIHIILTIFLDNGNVKTKQAELSVFCYGVRICNYKAMTFPDTCINAVLDNVFSDTMAKIFIHPYICLFVFTCEIYQ
jgi:hypothetical protein